MGDFVDNDFRVYHWSRNSARLGIAALGFGLAMPLTCYATAWCALPMGLLAATMGYWSWQQADPDSKERAYGKVGLITGVLCSAFTLFYLLCAIMYFGFLMLLIVAG